MQVAFEAIHIRDKTLSFTETADWTSIKMNKDFPREVAGWGLFFGLSGSCSDMSGKQCFILRFHPKYEAIHK